jgi:hypothetical protein
MAAPGLLFGIDDPGAIEKGAIAPLELRHLEAHHRDLAGLRLVGLPEEAFRGAAFAAAVQSKDWAVSLRLASSKSQLQALGMLLSG